MGRQLHDHHNTNAAAPAPVLLHNWNDLWGGGFRIVVVLLRGERVRDDSLSLQLLQQSNYMFTGYQRKSYVYQCVPLPARHLFNGRGVVLYGGQETMQLHSPFIVCLYLVCQIRNGRAIYGGGGVEGEGPLVLIYIIYG